MAVDINEGTIARFREIFESGSIDQYSEQLYNLAAEDVVEEWPQSGERIRGRDNIKAINDNYEKSTGSNPKGKVNRVTGSGDHWVLEGTIDYGDGVPVSYVNILELRDGKVARTTEYFANPFEAPAWRSQWVEKMR
jgi:ketosteroid isomerase-like protein